MLTSQCTHTAHKSPTHTNGWQHSITEKSSFLTEDHFILIERLITADGDATSAKRAVLDINPSYDSSDAVTGSLSWALLGIVYQYLLLHDEDTLSVPSFAYCHASSSNNASSPALWLSSVSLQQVSSVSLQQFRLAFHRRLMETSRGSHCGFEGQTVVAHYLPDEVTLPILISAGWTKLMVEVLHTRQLRDVVLFQQTL